MRFARLVWANLMRRKLRTGLTMGSIFVAFLLFGILCTIREAFSAGINLAGADRLIVRHRVSLIMLLPRSYAERIAAVPGVDAVVHWTWFNGVYRDDPRNFFGTFPVEPDAFLDMHREYELPEDQANAWRRTRTGAIVGRALADRFGWAIGDRIPLVSPLWPRDGGGAWEFEVVGIFEAAKRQADTSNFFFRHDYFDEARAEGKGQIGWFMVRVDDPDRTAEVAAAIDAEFANSPAETKAEPEGAFAQGFIEQIGSIGTILMAILGAVFFTILLVAGNTMAQAVRERTQEIGVLKALGFTGSRVLWIVLAESCLLAAIGGLAGLAAAWAITVGGSPVPALLPVFYLPGRDLLIGAALVVALGIVAGALPAIAAMRLQVAAALRRNA
ncbi:MAG TPA: ABC transporter permease [Phycisphaerales bacterium]|nr:ABC transporter permease [Phycisphaerales bacterium]HMP36548.1 ABC transporter permease [Phycisphaerales bacterium]